eukprot:2885262-Prorocentrum_lima.AAC.1
MTSSLVGSEMCIRDSSFTWKEQPSQQSAWGENPVKQWKDHGGQTFYAVSYTHLTLPTICSV